MNRIMNILLVMVAFAAVSCQKPAVEQAALADPSDLKVEQVDEETVVLRWTDNASGEVGYRVFLRGEGDSYSVDPLETIAADAVEHTFGGLTAGVEYDFGVQAVAAELRYHSKVVYYNNFVIPVPEEPEVPVDPVDPEVDPQVVPSVTKVKASYAYIAVSYKVAKINGSNPEHGVCFSASGVPTVDDIKSYGPEIKANTEILQVVPNAYLEDGVEYQMCVYIKDGSDYRYSEPQTVKLEAQPAAVELKWEKQTYAGLPADVEVYKTTSKLNDRNFNAWYAIADPSKVDFRVLYPETVGTKKTVASQAEAAGDCLALINGAIYGNYNIGVIITEGKMTQQWHGEIEGCYWATNSQLYQLTRPIIGVDKDGKAGAYWVGVPQQGTFYYYDRPQPNVVGQAKYGKVTSTSPVPAVSWEPYYAISCGPMVLYDGLVCADNSMVDDTHYYTNFECWDESGVYSAHPDRTAVGVTADGKIVLFICDGRIDASQGAYIKELGPIMKSIGCVHAMNLDGGGSTGMWLSGAGMINYKDSSWRAVKSTLGFFTK
ncbi:MAG: phosphodiester glycosidase family protein [Bacteroidales bacterium]|nr:phosphodiester glycosidase family protein [Bacteroidales bacterium]